MSRVADIIDKRFGRLVVIRRSGSDKSGKATWLCKCDCGSSVILNTSRLTTGNTRSCGCLRKEEARRNKLHHGRSHTRTHNIWVAMRKRCNNVNASNFYLYGGRGIKVCSEWDVFENFLNDMGQCPGPKYSIDRIDNSKGYSKDNCRWGTRTIQNNNTRRNRRIEMLGRNLTLSEWAMEAGLSYGTLYSRIFESKWDPAKAILTPTMRCNGKNVEVVNG